jgi:hypothetical protein
VLFVEAESGFVLVAVCGGLHIAKTNRKANQTRNATESKQKKLLLWQSKTKTHNTERKNKTQLIYG